MLLQLPSSFLRTVSDMSELLLHTLQEHKVTHGFLEVRKCVCTQMKSFLSSEVVCRHNAPELGMQVVHCHFPYWWWVPLPEALRNFDTIVPEIIPQPIFRVQFDVFCSIVCFLAEGGYSYVLRGAIPVHYAIGTFPQQD